MRTDFNNFWQQRIIRSKLYYIMYFKYDQYIRFDSEEDVGKYELYIV